MESEEPTLPPSDLGVDPGASYIPPPSGASEEATAAGPSARWSLVATAPGDETAGGEDAAAGEGPAAEGPAYELHRVVGRGGMGEVWEAVQVALDRVVAVKRLRFEAAGESPAERAMQLRSFRQEAMIAARLEHPNIVPVHDLGRDAGGSPLIAMKLVVGDPWDRMLARDLKEMAPEELLAKHLPILVDVAQAAAFAHSRGIVHRDIKPAQVMLGEFGEVLLTDWGLAVLAGEPAAAPAAAARGMLPTTRTASSPAGTPALMAPEQTERGADGVGPWTDIYLLGGTLYFLLTGSYPHRGRTAAESFLFAADGVVQPPSERAPERRVPPELEAICLRALAREPKDRFASARDFVAAIEDYRSGASRRRESRALVEAIAQEAAAGPRDYRAFASLLARLAQAQSLWPGNPDAGPLREGLLERQARFALANGDLKLASAQAELLAPGGEREGLFAAIDAAAQMKHRRERQRTAAIRAAAASAAIIIVGGTAFSVSLWRSWKESERERTRAVLAEGEARTASHMASDARTRAEDLIQFMLSDLRDGLIPVGKVELLRAPSQKAREYYASLPASLLTPDARMRQAMALRNVADSLSATGDLAGAAAVLGEARAIADAALVSDATDRAARAMRAQLMVDTASIRQKEGDLAAGKGLLEEALAIRLELLAAAPADLGAAIDAINGHERLGAAQQLAGNLEAAIACYAEALRLALEAAVRHPDADAVRHEIGVCHGELGRMAEYQGKLDAALASYRAGAQVWEELLAKSPGDAARMVELATAHDNIGGVLFAQGKIEAANAEFARMRILREQLAAKDPANTARQMDLVYSLHRIGRVHEAQGNLPAALECNRQFAAILERLLVIEPGNAEWNRGLSIAHSAIATVLDAMGENAEALEEFRRAADISRRLAEQDPASSDLARESALGQSQLGLALLRSGDREGARRCFAEFRAAMEALVARDATNATWQIDLGVSRVRMGGVLEEDGDYAAARAEYREYLRIVRALKERNGASAFLLREESVALSSIASAELALGDAAAAQPLLEEAAAILLGLAESEPSNLGFRSDLANAAAALSVAAERNGSAAADATLQRALAAAAESLAADPRDAARRRNWGRALLACGTAEPGSDARRAYLEEAAEALVPLALEPKADRRRVLDPCRTALEHLGRAGEAAAIAPCIDTP